MVDAAGIPRLQAGEDVKNMVKSQELVSYREEDFTKKYKLP